MSDLVVVYGPPFSGKTELAWAIARHMPGKSAVFSADSLLRGAIAVPSEDPRAELEMAHGQLKLLVAYYLKHRYHLVVEGPFLFERGGDLVTYESHIDQLIALMRNMTLRSLIVRLEASDQVLLQRARDAGRPDEGAQAVRLASLYRTRPEATLMSFNTGAHSADEIAAAVQEELARVMPFGRR